MWHPVGSCPDGMDVTGQRKEELLGVAFNRLMRMGHDDGRSHQNMALQHHEGIPLCFGFSAGWIINWFLCFPKAWNVNWEVKHVMVQFEEENVIFSCLSTDFRINRRLHLFVNASPKMPIRLLTKSSSTSWRADGPFALPFCAAFL